MEAISKSMDETAVDAGPGLKTTALILLISTFTPHLITLFLVLSALNGSSHIDVRFIDACTMVKSYVFILSSVLIVMGMVSLSPESLGSLFYFVESNKAYVIKYITAGFLFSGIIGMFIVSNAQAFLEFLAILSSSQTYGPFPTC